MGKQSAIEWTDGTWNPTVGCTKVSPGCDNCYAETFVNRFAGSKGFPLPFEQMYLRGDRFLNLPLTWREPRRVFVNSLSDLFHDDVPDDFLARVFATMATGSWHTFQLLTKRHGRMRSLLSSPRWPELLVASGRWPTDVDPELPLPNVWLGVSVEDQKRADLRIPALLATPAAVRWISAEPLLGPVNLGFIRSVTELSGQQLNDGGAEASYVVRTDRLLDWVVVGGESGPGARPMNPAWARRLRDDCVRAGVPFLYKQWGNHDEHGRNVGKKAAGRLLDGRTWDEYPARPVDSVRPPR